jgi:hypothetical protein
MKTFESLWTAETVQQIRREFVQSTQNYICNASPTFEDIWADFEEEIRALAEKFIPESQDVSTSNVLFINPELDNRKIRIDFLDYCLTLHHENKTIH